ncbi:MAG: hypothetical protein RLZZ455_872 [Candidatus Parcubacteria bacterium]|jgi:S-DNA-T family DNA segregation ATPase FtsK/SpoIIIE
MSDNVTIEKLESQIVDLKIRVQRLEEYIRAFPDKDEYLNLDVMDDSQLEDVIRLICQFNSASASFLQRKMSIGYSRAARILDQLEDLGIVGPAEGSKPREVLERNAVEYLKQKKS